ncbi:Uncharacterised protein [Collinsella intestinalis]|nr:Uncharacterised protein [Collinsella intestinalis]
MRRGKVDALDSGVAHAAEQLGKTWVVIVVAPIGVDVLAKKRDGSNALADKPGHLIDDFVHGTALLASANVWNDAIAAEIIAAGHDRNPCVISGLTMPRHIGGSAGVDLLDTDMMVAVCEGIGQEIGDMGD